VGVQEDSLEISKNESRRELGQVEKVRKGYPEGRGSGIIRNIRGGEPKKGNSGKEKKGSLEENRIRKLQLQ